MRITMSTGVAFMVGSQRVEIPEGTHLTCTHATNLPPLEDGPGRYWVTSIPDDMPKATKAREAMNGYGIEVRSNEFTAH
jgi:hypothetical protein